MGKLRDQLGDLVDDRTARFSHPRTLEPTKRLPVMHGPKYKNIGGSRLLRDKLASPNPPIRPYLLVRNEMQSTTSSNIAGKRLRCSLFTSKPHLGGGLSMAKDVHPSDAPVGIPVSSPSLPNRGPRCLRGSSEPSDTLHYRKYRFATLPYFINPLPDLDVTHRSCKTAETGWRAAPNLQQV